MAVSYSWPSTAGQTVTPTTYSIPQAGNVNWATLTNFLVALAQGAQATTFQLFANRVATTSPVSLGLSDCIVGINLTVPGAVAVTLPTGTDKQVMYITDQAGNASTYNITITPAMGQTIAGQSTLVLNRNNECVMLAFNSGTTDWKIIGLINPNPQGGDIGGFADNAAIISDGTGFLTSATGSQYQALVMGATAPGFGAIDLGQSAATTGILPIASGGTSVASVTIAPTASGWAGWDANKNLSANSFIPGYTTTITSATPVTLTVSSSQRQFFTGTLIQTVVLPVTSTLVVGQNFELVNNSTNTITVTSSGGSTVITLPALTSANITCVLTTGTGAGSWVSTFDLSPGGVLGVGFGGTGLSSGTSGGILGFTGTTTIASSAALTVSQLIVGGGAGATPATLAAGSQYQALVMGASVPGYGQVNLGQSAAITGTLPIGNGGTNVTSVTIAPTSTAFAGWDANKNLSASSFISGYTTTAASVTTLVLTVGSTYQQYITGTTTQLITLPVANTLVEGWQVEVVNSSNSTVTVQSSGANTVQAMVAGTTAIFTCILNSGTSAASWAVQYISTAGAGTVTSVAATVPPFLSISGSPITVSGTLAITVANGTSGGILGYTGTNTLASSTALTANQLIVGGGAGATPSTLAAGTAGQYLQMNATPIPAWYTIPSPTAQIFSANYYWTFTVTSANATAGATYTNNSVTYTVIYTIAGGTTLVCSSPTTSSLSGTTLTKASGTGDSTITESARASNGTYNLPTNCKWINVEMIGAGGGGGGSGTTPNAGGAGGNTTFGTSLLTANGGGGNTGNVDNGGVGGTATIASPAYGTALSGGNGQGTINAPASGNNAGAFGAPSAFGGAGTGRFDGSAYPGVTNTGGGGAAGTASGASVRSGGGGGAGGYIDAIIPAPSSTYTFVIGVAGTAGSAGTGFAGAAGGSGLIKVIEYYN